MKTKLALTLAGFLVAISMNTFAATSTMHQNVPLSDSLLIKPYLTGKKNVVRLYPNYREDGSITFNSVTQSELHFYIFDLEGVMLYSSILKGHQNKKIPDLRKGIYTYDVFKNDESIEQGSIVVK